MENYLTEENTNGYTNEELSALNWLIQAEIEEGNFDTFPEPEKYASEYVLRMVGGC
jgi:hypothetical protein